MACTLSWKAENEQLSHDTAPNSSPLYSSDAPSVLHSRSFFAQQHHLWVFGTQFAG